MRGIFIFWGKDCQCKYIQTVEFTLCFDLISLKSVNVNIFRLLNSFFALI